ncbi:hypothetical protein R3P38DRAFT_3368495 [Favolaschia claudopus]|uniref:Nephrocystin 3-like N-terminal domain-containing protein n=1 Tax=Favolaschia claudopus TaxID=2862362 RepID=A0AAW0A6L3_9AGAR
MHVRKALCDALSQEVGDQRIGYMHQHTSTDLLPLALSAEVTLVDADYRTQFQKLLLDPLTTAAPSICGPIVIIVDALDECLDCSSRKALLSLIASDMAKLPAAFRLLVTSRPDPDIAHLLRMKAHITPRQLDIRTEDNKKDILCYLRQCMQNVREEWSLAPHWPGEHVIQFLATLSGGLFIWAATAFKFIQAFNPPTRLKQLLAAGEIIHNDLDQLYSMALEHAGDWTNATFSFSALSLVACVILSREPLTAETMTSIICYGQEELGMPVLEFLGSVLHWGPGVPLSTLHASFSDYITDPNRSGTKPCFIDINLHSSGTQAAIQYLRPDLAERVGTHIPESLKYVSQYWAHHLHATATSPAPIVLDGLKTFASQHFLYWLEVLSLLGHVSGAHEAVEIAQTYAQGKDQALEALLHECHQVHCRICPSNITEHTTPVYFCFGNGPT